MVNGDDRFDGQALAEPVRLLVRLAISIAAAVASAVAVAIAAALIDLYLTGHGHDSIMREVIRWPAAGVHLSVPYIVFLIASIGAGILTWRLTALDKP